MDPMTLSALADEFDISPAELVAMVADAILVDPSIARQRIAEHQAAEAAAGEAKRVWKADLDAQIAEARRANGPRRGIPVGVGINSVADMIGYDPPNDPGSQHRPPPIQNTVLSPMQQLDQKAKQ